MTPSDYKFIAAWESLKDSPAATVEQLQRSAFAAHAPIDAVFFSLADNRWKRFGEIESHLMRAGMEAFLKGIGHEVS